MTSKNFIDNWENSFNCLYQWLLSQVNEGEFFTVQLTGESSHFIRFSQAKVRQTGLVWDAQVELSWMGGGRTMTFTFPLVGDENTDLTNVEIYFKELTEDMKNLPVDAYQVLPEVGESSYEVYQGDLLSTEGAIKSILSEVDDLDFTGFYASGEMIRASYNSLGVKHWFVTPSFWLDYSLINEQEKSLKGVISAPVWHQKRYEKQISALRHLLPSLSLPEKEIKPGRYRTYLSPSAVANLVDMFSWGAISEASLRQGGSALGKMRYEGWELSPLFNLAEDFSRGNVPRFNGFGEISPSYLPLIQKGKLVNTLINRRTAKEYNITGNGACVGESLRTPVVSGGTLFADDILKEIDTGLYISNLHYLNWSERAGGRVTGMTRYGCFWVENGEIVTTIKDIRFDDSFYRYFGDNLINLTDFVEFIPYVSSYNNRALGGCTVPGALVADFCFTL